MFIRVNYLRKNTMHDFFVETEEASTMKQGDFVILRVVGEDREELGKIVLKHNFEEDELQYDVAFVRKAHDADVQRIYCLQESEKNAFQLFVKKVEQYGLDMQPLAVFYSFDGKYADFVFTAKERVDFREMVKDLASQCKKKIFLEQVGPRDRSSMKGGCGTCGRTLCCSTFLKDPPPVSMTSVRHQNLFFKDRDKLTGLCGKLKCCLNYELSVYEELAKNFPPVQSEIQVKSTGKIGIVVGRSILDQQVKVLYHESCARAELVAVVDIHILKKAEIKEETSALKEVLDS